MSAMYECCHTTVKEVENTPSREEILRISPKLGAEFADGGRKQARLKHLQEDPQRACRLSSSI